MLKEKLIQLEIKCIEVGVLSYTGNIIIRLP